MACHPVLVPVVGIVKPTGWSLVRFTPVGTVAIIFATLSGAVDGLTIRELNAVTPSWQLKQRNEAAPNSPVLVESGVYIVKVLDRVSVRFHRIGVDAVVWGVWHALGLFVHNRWAEFAKAHDLSRFARVGHLLGPVLTFHYVALGWVWFALPTLGLSIQTFMRMVGR